MPFPTQSLRPVLHFLRRFAAQNSRARSPFYRRPSCDTVTEGPLFHGDAFIRDFFRSLLGGAQV